MPAQSNLSIGQERLLGNLYRTDPFTYVFSSFCFPRVYVYGDITSVTFGRYVPRTGLDCFCV